MLTILLLMVGAVMLVVLLAVVVVGIRQEPPGEELTVQAPSFIATLVRRLLGVYVRKPEQPVTFEDRGESCLTSRDPTRRSKRPAE
jgi:hypothetical protein